VAVRLRDIDNVSIIKDISLNKALGSKATEMNSDLAISITLIPGAKSDIKEPLIFGTLTDNIEAVVEKLKFAVDNAKSDEVSIMYRGKSTLNQLKHEYSLCKLEISSARCKH
jgi:hypothetical protein